MPEFTVTAEEVSGDIGTFYIRALTSVAVDTTVNFLMAGTATEGVHYPFQSGSVTVLAGDTVATVSISLNANITLDETKSVVLLLVSDPAYTIGTPNNATLLVSDLATEAGKKMQAAIDRLCQQLDTESATMDSYLSKVVNLPVFPKLANYQARFTDICLILTRYALTTKPGQRTTDIRQDYDDVTAWLRSAARGDVCLTAGENRQEKQKICAIARKTKMNDLPCYD